MDAGLVPTGGVSGRGSDVSGVVIETVPRQMGAGLSYSFETTAGETFLLSAGNARLSRVR